MLRGVGKCSGPRMSPPSDSTPVSVSVRLHQGGLVQCCLRMSRKQGPVHFCEQGRGWDGQGRLGRLRLDRRAGGKELGAGDVEAAHRAAAGGVAVQ